MYKPDKEALEDVVETKGLRGLAQLQRMVRDLQIMVDDPDHDPKELKKRITQLRYWAGQ